MGEVNAGFGLGQIGQIHVRARDVDRAVAFYRDTLGMRYLFQVPTMAFFQCGEVTIMLGVPEEAQFDHPASIIYYLVEDIGTAFETLSRRGVSFKAAPHLIHKAPDHDLWMAFFRDSEDNMAALMSRVPRG